MASSVAGVLEPTLQAAETARSTGRPTADLTAYDLYLRAYAMVWSSARQIPEALHLLEQAIARDRRYGPALALAAICCYRLDREADRPKGVDFARPSGIPPKNTIAGNVLAFTVLTSGALFSFGDNDVKSNGNDGGAIPLVVTK